MRNLILAVATIFATSVNSQELPSALQGIYWDSLVVKTVSPIVNKDIDPYKATFAKVYGEDKVDEVFKLLNETADRGVQFGINLSEETLYSYKIRSENFEGTLIIHWDERSIQVINSHIK
jgi:hypothetical protein